MSSSRSQHTCRTRHPTAAGCMVFISSLWWLLQAAYGTEGFITAFSLMNIILRSYFLSIPHLFFPFPPLYLPLLWISFPRPPQSSTLHLPYKRQCDICLPASPMWETLWYLSPWCWLLSLTMMVLPIFLQVTYFCSLLWQNQTPLSMYTDCSFFIHSSVECM